MLGTAYRSVVARPLELRLISRCMAPAFAGLTTFNQLVFARNVGTELQNGTFGVSFYYSTKSVNNLDGSDPINNRGAFIGDFGSFALSGTSPALLALTGSTLTYDPALGNLLVDIDVAGGTGGSTYFNVDLTGSVTSRAVFGSSNFADSAGLVTTFGTVGTALPEPATWAMMMLGFGLVGAGLRRRSKVTTRVAFA